MNGDPYIKENDELRAEIARLQSQWTAMKDEVNFCHRWIAVLEAALERQRSGNDPR